MVALVTDMMSAGQSLLDVDAHEFDKTDKVQPQIEQMTKCVYASKYCNSLSFIHA